VVAGSGGGEFSIYPNPAESEVTISVSDASSSSSSFTSDNEDVYISSVTFIDLYGQPRKIKQYGTGLKSVTVNVSDLPKGIYVIRVNNNIDSESYRFLIQ
jgi:hypothetical protein